MAEPLRPRKRIAPAAVIVVASVDIILCRASVARARIPLVVGIAGVIADDVVGGGDTVHLVLCGKRLRRIEKVNDVKVALVCVAKDREIWGENR